MAKETVRCVCKVDKAFPISPAGILKIIEMILGLIQLILVAVGRNSYDHVVKTPTLVESVAAALDTVGTYPSLKQFCLAAVILAWFFTILIFFLFLFCVPEMAGGNQIWNIIDLVLIVIWAVFYLLVFIFLCVVCGYPSDHSLRYSTALIVGIIFGLLLLIAYIISLVFAVFALKGKKLY